MEKNSWFGIYIFYNDRVEFLSERNQQLPTECNKQKKECVKFLSSVKKVRVIGIESSDFFEDSDLAIILKNPKIKSVNQNWTYSRIISDKGCLGWVGCEELKLVEKDIYSNIYESGLTH